MRGTFANAGQTLKLLKKPLRMRSELLKGVLPSLDQVSWREDDVLAGLIIICTASSSDRIM